MAAISFATRSNWFRVILRGLRHRHRAAGDALLGDDETSDSILTDQRRESLERCRDDHSAVVPESEGLLGNGVKGLAFSLAADLGDSFGAPDRLVQVPAFAAKLDGRHRCFLRLLCRRNTLAPAIYRIRYLHPN